MFESATAAEVLREFAGSAPGAPPFCSFRHACARKRLRREVDVSSAGTKLKSTSHIPHKLPASRFRHLTPPRAHICAGLLSEPPPPAPHRKAVWVPEGEISVGEGPRSN